MSDVEHFAVNYEPFIDRYFNISNLFHLSLASLPFPF